MENNDIKKIDFKENKKQLEYMYYCNYVPTRDETKAKKLKRILNNIRHSIVDFAYYITRIPKDYD